MRTSFLVRQKELLTNKLGKPYLALLLMDRTGEVDSRVWESAESLSQVFNEGDVVAIGGKTHLFQDRMQLVIDDLVRIPEEMIRLDDYLPRTQHDLEQLYRDLVAIFAGFENPHLKALALSLLNDPEIAYRYKLCPAAKTIHHAFLGGLLCHSLHLIKVVNALHPLYPHLDRELMIFGAAFHDFGKIFELSYTRGFGYTDEGRLVGHITIGVTLVDRKIRELPGFPQKLEWHVKHLILSHHGKLEYGSPKRPHTLEAEVLNLIDTLDSKVDSITTLLRATANSSVNTSNGNGNAGWTAYHKAYDQYYWLNNWNPTANENPQSGSKPPQI